MSTTEQEPIPEAFEKWVDGDTKGMINPQNKAFYRQGAIAAYRHLSSQQKAASGIPFEELIAKFKQKSNECFRAASTGNRFWQGVGEGVDWAIVILREIMTVPSVQPIEGEQNSIDSELRQLLHCMISAYEGICFRLPSEDRNKFLRLPSFVAASAFIHGEETKEAQPIEPSNI